MDGYICWELGEHSLEYYDDEHLYLVDALPVDSITQILGKRYSKEYADIDPTVLRNATRKGTKVHEAIECWCKGDDEEKKSLEADYPEVRSFKTLKRLYDFEVLENEMPVILWDKKGEVVAAGRLDMVIKMDGKIGGADIKRTSSVNKEKFGYQLNLYRLAYMQTYGVEWEFLRIIHVREDVKQFIELPINEEMTWKLIEEYKNGR